MSLLKADKSGPYMPSSSIRTMEFLPPILLEACSSSFEHSTNTGRTSLWNSLASNDHHLLRTALERFCVGFACAGSLGSGTRLRRTTSKIVLRCSSHDLI